jgi:hypothetical protein
VPAVADLKLLPDLLHVLDEVSSGVVSEAGRRGRVARAALVKQDDPVGLGIKALSILVVGSSSLEQKWVSSLGHLSLTSWKRTGPP